MKRYTGILVALLMITLGISEFIPEEEYIFEQLMRPNKVYYIYSEGYPEYYHGERQSRFTGRIPDISLRVERAGKIKVFCNDIDFPEVERCPADNASSITINVHREPAHRHSAKDSTFMKCGFGQMEGSYKTERIDIDWNAKNTRGRFSCAMIAAYTPNPKLDELVYVPNQFHVNPPPAHGCACGRENVPKKNVLGSLGYEADQFGKFGYEAGMNQYPFMADLVQYKDSKSKFYCGASIISQRYALSSSQCKYYNGFEKGELRLRVGDHNNKIENETNQAATYVIEWMKPHETWSYDTRYFNDIMLIKTKDFIKFGYGVGAICLPYSGDGLYTKREVKILGWGSNSNGKYPDILKEIRTKLTTECARDGNEKEKDRRLCTHENAHGYDPYYGTCKADTGGPLFVKDSNRNILLGILTLQGCSNSKVDVFTRVTRYLHWIKETTTEGEIYC